MSTETQRSRRWFVAAVGGVAAASATVVWRSRQATGERRLAARLGESPGYVDHDGWIVTPADQQRLLSARPRDAGDPPSGGESGSEW